MTDYVYRELSDAILSVYCCAPLRNPVPRAPRGGLPCR